jgi:hypothetical protein
MPQYFVRQPNGKLARFSTIVDSFCDIHLSRAEAEKWCIRQGMTESEAIAKVKRAIDDEPINGEPRHCDEKLHRWIKSLITILAIKGTDELTDILNEYRDAARKQPTRKER